MTEVISVKFKSRGKCYFFAPGELTVPTGEKVIVETSKGIEIADCVRGNHNVPDEAVIPPLRPVVRIATSEDRRTEQLNRQREQDAYRICQQKIAEHGLDMKLVDVECNFDGSKTLYFFTSDGRVDFRELVKDLAGIFRNRIELRQIGVRDEAKMIGGIGICGRPYCCNQFLDDFQPVSTKMAKLQSLSLNPTKISGSCGRLMCCLRYEQEAYEDLVKKVPKQGAFVETKDGFGTAVQVNLLRQTVQVKLDGDGDDAAVTFKANELCTVPGGRPKDGEAPVSTLVYVPEEEEDEDVEVASFVVPDEQVSVVQPRVEPQENESADKGEHSRRHSRGRKGGNESRAQFSPRPVQSRKHEPQPESKADSKADNKPENKPDIKGEGKNDRRRRGNHSRDGAKAVKVEAKPVHQDDKKPPREKPKSERKAQVKVEAEGAHEQNPSRPHHNNRRRFHGDRRGSKPQGENNG